MNPIMALTTQSSKIFVFTQPLTHPASLMVYVSGFFVFATLALWMESKIRTLYLIILTILLCAFWGCSPQPAAALKGSKSVETGLFH
jgi:hypothetical protein